MQYIGSLYPILVSIIIFTSCSPKVSEKNLSLSQDPDLLKLEYYLDKNGGYDRWEKLDAIHFDKHTRVFDQSGILEIDKYEKTSLEYDYGMHGSISWKDDGVAKKYVRRSEERQYLERGRVVEDSTILEKLDRAFITGHYVFGLPFKLMDPGLILEWVDQAPFDLQGGYEILHVLHPAENLDEPDLSEQWWVYFDKETGYMKAYLIWHEGRYSFITNDSFTQIEEFTFPHKRSSFIMDSSFRKRYLRASYEYDHYELIYRK